MPVGRYLKVAGVVLAVIAIWNLLQSPALWEALLLFGASGELPGTHVVLSPGATMRVLAAVLALSLLLIFHSELWRGVRYVLGRRPVPGTTALPLAQADNLATMPAPLHPLHVMPAPEPKPVVVIRVPGRAGKIVRAYRLVRPLIRPAAGRAVRVVRQVLMAAWALMRRCWNWLEPRIRQFDQWLEKQVKRNPKARAAIESGARLGHVAAAARLQLRTYVARVFQK